MEIKNFSFCVGDPVSKKIYLMLMALILVNCSQIQTRKDIKSKKLSDQTAVLVDQGKEEVDEPPAEEKPIPKLGLVLGPGSVKAFAHTGIIKELEKARIPISYIVGIEWGALVGGLYASHAKINDTEWKLYKLQSKKLKKESWFSSSKKSQTIRSYKAYFDKNLGKGSMAQLKIPFACPSISILSGRIVWQELGPLRRAVERCMPSPPLFTPQSGWMAAMFSSEEAVDFLHKKGMDVVLYVDVLGKSQPLSTKELTTEFTSALLWQELKNDISRVQNSERVIKVGVNTLKFRLYDFSSRSSLSAAGNRAGRLAVDKLVENFDF